MPTTTIPEQAAEPVRLELLFLDLDTCDPCRGASDSVDEAVQALGEALAAAGRRLEVRRVHVTDPDQARALGFVSSPTVRVDGTDIALEVTEAHCGTCSAIAREPVACRTFAHEGRLHEHPPAAMVVQAVLRHLRGATPAGSPTPAADTPTSVERFLAARARA